MHSLGRRLVDNSKTQTSVIFILNLHVFKGSTVSLMCAVHTSAAKPCVFTVTTVMAANSIVAAVYKSSLPAVTVQVIKMYGTCSLAKWCTGKCLSTCSNGQKLMELHHSQ